MFSFYLSWGLCIPWLSGHSGFGALGWAVMLCYYSPRGLLAATPSCRKPRARLVPESAKRGTVPAVYSPLSGQAADVLWEVHETQPAFHTLFSLHAVTTNCASAMWVKTCTLCCLCSARALVRSCFYPTSPLRALMLCSKHALIWERKVFSEHASSILDWKPSSYHSSSARRGPIMRFFSV